MWPTKRKIWKKKEGTNLGTGGGVGKQGPLQKTNVGAVKKKSVWLLISVKKGTAKRDPTHKT